MKLIPQPKVKTQKDIQMYFKVRKVKFQKPSSLKKELYRQLGISELLDPIKSIADIAHEKTNFSFLLTIKSQDYILKYQYRDTEVKFQNDIFTINQEKLKKGFFDFDADEICSFIEYCIQDKIEFQILSTKSIDKDLLISKI